MFYLGGSLPRDIEQLLLLCILVTMFFHVEGTACFGWSLFAGEPAFQCRSCVLGLRYSTGLPDGIGR